STHFFPYTTLFRSMNRATINAYAKEIGIRLKALPVLKAEPIRAISREFSHRLIEAEPETVINLAMKLLEVPESGYHLIAYELIHHHRSALISLDAGTLEQLGRGLDSWVAVDTFACYLAGPAWRNRQ